MNIIRVLLLCTCLGQLSRSEEVQHLRLGPYDHVYPYVDIARNQQNCSVAENGTCPLYIALMMSFGGDFDSRGVIPGIQIAIDQINNDPTMLPGYSLHYILKKTEVNILSGLSHAISLNIIFQLYL